MDSSSPRSWELPYRGFVREGNKIQSTEQRLWASAGAHRDRVLSKLSPQRAYGREEAGIWNVPGSPPV